MSRPAPQIRVYLLVGPPVGAFAAVALSLVRLKDIPFSGLALAGNFIMTVVLAYPFGALPAIFTGLLSLGFRRHGPFRYVCASMLIGALTTTLPVVGMAALIQAGTPAEGDDPAAVLRAGLLAAAVGAPAAMVCALTTLLWPADLC